MCILLESLHPLTYRSYDLESSFATMALQKGINPKIRGLLAAAYGMTDSDFLKPRLCALHETKWKFTPNETLNQSAWGL